MVNLPRTCGLVILALTAMGCSPEQKPATDPLIVDITAVAKALGRDEVMARQLEATREQLNQQLTEITRNLNTQIEEKRVEFGEDASEADTQTLQNLALKARQTLQHSREMARQQALAYHGSLLQDFREEVRAEASAIARERGATSVLNAGDTTLWFDPQTDITGEVIARMRAADNRRDDESESPADNTEKQPSGAADPR